MIMNKEKLKLNKVFGFNGFNGCENGVLFFNWKMNLYNFMCSIKNLLLLLVFSFLFCKL